MTLLLKIKNRSCKTSTKNQIRDLKVSRLIPCPNFFPVSNLCTTPDKNPELDVAPFIRTFDDGKLFSYLRSTSVDEGFLKALLTLTAETQRFEQLLKSVKSAEEAQEVFSKYQSLYRSTETNLGNTHQNVFVESEALNLLDRLCLPKENFEDVDPKFLSIFQFPGRILKRRNKKETSNRCRQLNRIFQVFARAGESFSVNVLYSITGLHHKSFTSVEKVALTARLTEVGTFMDSLRNEDKIPFREKELYDSSEFPPEDDLQYYAGATLASSLTSSLFFRYRVLLAADPLYSIDIDRYTIPQEDEKALSLWFLSIFEASKVIKFHERKPGGLKDSSGYTLNATIIKNIASPSVVFGWPAFQKKGDHILTKEKKIDLPLTAVAEAQRLKEGKPKAQVSTNRLYSHNNSFSSRSDTSSVLGKAGLKSFSSFPPEVSNVLDNFQKVGFKIDQDMMSFVLDNGRLFFEQHMKTFLANNSESSFNALRHDYKCLNREHFLGEHIDYIYRDIPVNSRLSSSKNKELIARKRQRVAELNEYFRTYSQLTVKFFRNVLMLQVLSKISFPFFYGTSLDAVGRIYILGGGSLSPMAGGFVRYCLTFFDEDQDELPVDSATFFKTYQKSLNQLQFCRNTSFKKHEATTRIELPNMSEENMLGRLEELILLEEIRPSSLEYLRALPSKTFFQATYLLCKLLQYPERRGSKRWLVTIDATASGCSILSGFCGNERGLKLTNVVQNKGREKKQDFYELFGVAIIAQITDIISQIELSLKEVSLDQEQIDCFRTEIQYWKIVRISTTRDRVKGIMMPAGYGQGNEKRFSMWLQDIERHVIRVASHSKFKKVCYENVFIKKFKKLSKNVPTSALPDLYGVFTSVSGAFKKKARSKGVSLIIKNNKIELKAFKFCMSIESWRDLHKTRFLFEKNLRASVKESDSSEKEAVERTIINNLKDFKNSDLIRQYESEVNQFEQLKRMQQARLQEKIDESFPCPFLALRSGGYQTWISVKKDTRKLSSALGLGKKRRVAYSFEEDSSCAAKIAKKSMVSITHFIDSKLLFGTVQSLNPAFKAKAPFRPYFTLHDAVRVQMVDVPAVKKCYFDSYVNVVLKRSVLKDFCEDNGVVLNPKAAAVWEKNRGRILEKLKTGELEMSDFILSE